MVHILIVSADHLTLHKVISSPSKDTVNLSGNDLRHGGGPAISSTDGEPSLTAELLSGRSENLSDLTSLPSDYRGSPSSTSKSLFMAGQLLGIPVVNGKNRRVVMDYVSLPSLQQDRKQLPTSSDRPSSSMVTDHASVHSRSMVFSPYFVFYSDVNVGTVVR